MASCPSLVLNKNSTSKAIGTDMVKNCSKRGMGIAKGAGSHLGILAKFASFLGNKHEKRSK